MEVSNSYATSFEELHLSALAPRLSCGSVFYLTSVFLGLLALYTDTPFKLVIQTWSSLNVLNIQDIMLRHYIIYVHPNEYVCVQVHWIVSMCGVGKLGV